MCRIKHASALFFTLSFVLIAAMSEAAIHIYVSTAGSDTTGYGSLDRPYRTIKYAVGKAGNEQTVGVMDGIYYEDSIFLPAGISLTSVSQDASKVTIYPKCKLWSANPLLDLRSSTLSTSGNQSVSYLILDGTVSKGVYASRGIVLENRNDVHIHHCYIRNFKGDDRAAGITIRTTNIEKGGYWWHWWPANPGLLGDDSNIDSGTIKPWPSNPVERFELDHCNITACGYDSNGGNRKRGRGCISLVNLKNSRIHHNHMDNSTIDNACILGYYRCTAFLWNVDVYDNLLQMKQHVDRTSFIIETWVHRGGCEFYNNVVNGGFSITYGKNTEIRDNRLIASPYISDNSGATLGIEFTHQSYGKVLRNYVEGFAHACVSSGTTFKNWHVLHDTEICNNICVAPTGFGFTVSSDKSDLSVVDGWKIYNNTIESKGRIRYNGIRINANKGRLTNLEVVNNIVVGAGRNGGQVIVKDGAFYSGKVVSNNLFYNNKYDDWKGDPPSAKNSIVADPKFVTGSQGADAYKLQNKSPARNAGAPVSLSHDFGGYWSAIPSIGAWWGDELALRPLPPANVQVAQGDE